MGKNLLRTVPASPWEGLAAVRALAARHPDGLIDLSVGSPVDPVPDSVQRALAAAANAPGYTTAAGEPVLREAMVRWRARRYGGDLDISHFVPVLGLKEFIALLPQFLGLGPGDVMVQPLLHYPTYELGAELVGATVLSTDDPELWPAETRLIWLNSPSNPDGRVSSPEILRAAVCRARELGAVLVQDECYAEFSWAGPDDGSPAPSLLDPQVTGGDLTGLLSATSLSKRSNLAGYRAGVVCGDPALIGGLITVRKQIGLALPAPVQAAAAAALDDEEDVRAQRDRYRARRELLRPALEAWGLRLSGSEGGLYLWGSRGEPGEETLMALAELGILAAPGTFYGAAGASFVRLSTTATDAHIAEAARRLLAAAH